MPPDRVFINVALERLTFVSTVLLKSSPVKSVLERSTLAPIKYPLRTTYPPAVPAVNVGATVGCGMFLERVRVKVAPVKLIPSIIVPEISAYDRFVLTKTEPLSVRLYSWIPDKSFDERLTLGPRRKLFRNT